MGLIAAAMGTVGGVLADQWKEYFYCESISNDLLMVKGQKKTGGRSSNTKGSDNVISQGSIIAVADGQCMIIVENGKVAELCAQPGEYKYDSTLEPSIFAGNLGESIINTFKEIGKRFTFGGEPAKDQRVYYVTTKEIIGNKYGTAQPVPFTVIDQRANLEMLVRLKCFGEYSFRISDPIRFYTNIASNVTSEYEKEQLDSQMKSELLTALQPAFGVLSEKGIRYTSLTTHTMDLADALNQQLSAKWKNLRGMEIVSFGISSIKADEEDEKKLQDAQLNVTYSSDPRKYQTMMGMGTVEAMKAAANNSNGAAMGFMGMGMAGNMGMMGGMNAWAQQGGAGYPPQGGQVPPGGFAAGVAQQGGGQAAGGSAAAASAVGPAAGGWTCPACGSTATGKFCPNCGAQKPVATAGGPGAAGWTCSCGAVNKGKFCQECGKPKPAGAPLYKCDKCGWEPADPHNPPKFCPECGDPFDTGDIVG
ncbi:MAG: SPFH domain-containing protein [Treponema sp.]|nr:SPFH domain-containing protein [Treponema sp.]